MPRRGLRIGYFLAAQVLACGGLSDEGDLGDGTGGETTTDTATGTGGNADPVPLDELCDVAIDRMCTTMIDCYGWNYRDVEHCRGDQACWGFDVLQAAIDSGEVNYDPDLVGRCRALFEVEPCLYSFFFGVPTIDEMMAACPYSWKNGYGNVPAGEPCMTVISCDRNSECVFDGQCPGTCQAVAAEGETCGDPSGTQCSFRDSLVCEGGTCRSVPHEGWPCESDEECNGATCNRELSVIGVCDPGAREGEPCRDSAGEYCLAHLGCNTGGAETGVCSMAAAEGEWCGDDLWCQDDLACFEDLTDPSANACGLPVADGTACQSDDQCRSGYCNGSTDICEAKAGTGELCAGVDGCQDGHECDSGVCVALKYPGDACDDSVLVCQHSICEAGTCRFRAGLGEPCMADTDCTSETCLEDRCIDPATCG